MDSLNVPTNQPYRDPEPEQPPNRHKEVYSTLAILLLAPLIALFLTIFVFQSYEVEGASMETTLHDKDRLIVTKLGRSWTRITRGDYVPERYSIVVFNHSGPVSLGDKNRQLIKRVIGLPGDRVVVKDGIVTVYNEENPKGFFPDREGPQASVIKSTQDRVEQTVGEDEVFLLGDNRGNSLDSRVFGPVKTSNIVGTLSVRIFPLNAVQKF